MALTRKFVSQALLLLLPWLMAGSQSKAQLPDPKTAGQTSTTKPPAHPPRVVTDIASFNLEKRPESAKHGQIGAVSRGSQSVLALCAPHSGLASSKKPLFVWQTPSASSGPLKFSLYDADQSVLYEADTTGATLQYPDDAPPLVPGKTYQWTVTGNGSLDKLPPPAELTLQDQAASAPLMKEIAASADDPLARAQIFLHNQVWYDAVAEIERGLRRNPGRTDLTQQLQALYRQIAPACADSPR